MSPKEIYEPDFWTLTGARPAAKIPAPRISRRPRPMRSMQPTLMGLPERKLSIWRLVASMEAELLRAPRS